MEMSIGKAPDVDEPHQHFCSFDVFEQPMPVFIYSQNLCLHSTRTNAMRKHSQQHQHGLLFSQFISFINANENFNK